MSQAAAYWEMRFTRLASAFAELKTLTKTIPASQWTPEYRKLAEAIHNVGRDNLYVEVETTVPDATGFSLGDENGSK